MLKKYLKFNLFFILIFTLQLVAAFDQLSVLRNITKPMITLSLLLMLYLNTGLKGRFHKRVFAGLTFALIGDVLLMLNGQNSLYFSLGLLAVLICQIFYIRAFYLDFSSAPELDKRGAKIAILLCAIFSIGFYFYLRPYLGAMKLPVMVYIIVISIMTMMAAFRNMRVNRSSFNLILLGTICFMLSDFVLAYHKFVKGSEFAGLLIITSYMFAQYFITIGAAERKLLNKD